LAGILVQVAGDFGVAVETVESSLTRSIRELVVKFQPVKIVKAPDKAQLPEDGIKALSSFLKDKRPPRKKPQDSRTRKLVET